MGLTAIDISGNTMGVEGGKRMWDSVLVHPSICSLGLDNIGTNIVHNHESFPMLHKAFDPAVCPAGHWNLDMSMAWHRWLLLKMIERCQKEEFKARESIKNAKLGGQSFKAGKKKGGITSLTKLTLPGHGLLSFDYMLKVSEPLANRKVLTIPGTPPNSRHRLPEPF